MGRNTLMISEDDIDSFVLEVHSACEFNPLWFYDEDEGYLSFKEFIHERFEKYWPLLIKERNYN